MSKSTTDNPSPGQFFIGGDCPSCGGAIPFKTLPKEKMFVVKLRIKDGSFLSGNCLSCKKEGAYTEFNKYVLDMSGKAHKLDEGMNIIRSS